jgi:hypothetical protein
MEDESDDAPQGAGTARGVAANDLNEKSSESPTSGTPSSNGAGPGASVASEEEPEKRKGGGLSYYGVRA